MNNHLMPESEKRNFLNQPISKIYDFVAKPSYLQLSDPMLHAIKRISLDTTNFDGIVIKEKDIPAGVITGREIVSAISAGSFEKIIREPVGNHMSTELFSIDENTTISNFIQRVQKIRRGSGILFKNNVMIGKLSLKNVLAAYNKLDEDTTISDLPLRDPIRIDEDGTVKQALFTMQRNQIRHLFVGNMDVFLNDRHLLGYLDNCIEHDRFDALEHKVSHCTRTKAITLDESETIPLACQKMISSNSTCLLTNKGKVLTMWDLGMSIFISMLMEYEKKLKIRQKFLIIGELAARLNHDILNPITIIKNTSEILSSELTLNEKQVEQFQRIDRACNRITHQVRDVLNYVKTTPLKITEVQSRQVIDRGLERVQVPKDIKIVISGHSQTIFCDAIKLEVVIANIISNSISAIQELRPTNPQIRIYQGEDGPYHTIRIEDNGDGIPKENMQKIFEPLFTTRMQGTGLGLPTCKNIVEQHHGTIEVHSTVNSGSTFVIKLPKRHDSHKARNTYGNQK